MLNTHSPQDDAPPDVGILAEFVLAVAEGHPPSQAALEEAAELLEGLRKVAAEVRRKTALRLVSEFMATGQYSSVRAVAPRVAREVGAAAETVRQWVAAAGGCHPPAASTHGPP